MQGLQCGCHCCQASKFRSAWPTHAIALLTFIWTDRIIMTTTHPLALISKGLCPMTASSSGSGSTQTSSRAGNGNMGRTLTPGCSSTQVKFSAHCLHLPEQPHPVPLLLQPSCSACGKLSCKALLVLKLRCALYCVKEVSCRGMA